jgi:septum site-determining protein MinD
MLGKKVVCIDGDIGLRNLDVVLAWKTALCMIWSYCGRSLPASPAMIRDKRLPDLYLIPAAQTRDKSAVPLPIWCACVLNLRQEFDWILIDFHLPELSAASAMQLAPRIWRLSSPIQK